MGSEFSQLWGQASFAVVSPFPEHCVYWTCGTVSKQKVKFAKIELQSSLRVTEDVHIAWITFTLPQDMAFRSSTPSYPLTKNRNTGKYSSNGRSYQWNRKEEPKCFILMCCEAIDQNFDCGCILKKLCKFALISESTHTHKKNQYKKFGITGLKSKLRATEKYAHAWITFILPQDIGFQS